MVLASENSSSHVSQCVCVCASPRQSAPLSCQRAERKKENRQPKGGMGGRHAATTQGFQGEKCGASRRPPSGVYHFLSLFAVSHQLS